MMGHKNLSKSVAISAALLMALCAFAVFAVDSSDADRTCSVDYGGFKQDKAGTITIIVPECIEGEVLTFTAKESSDVKDTATVIVGEAGEATVKLSFKLSQGEHFITIDGTSSIDGTFHYFQTLPINSADNIWSHVTSYIVLIVVVIVVIVIAVLYIRAKPNNKPTTTFTQLEEEKKAARAESSKAAAPAKTEKVKYTSSRRK